MSLVFSATDNTGEGFAAIFLLFYNVVNTFKSLIKILRIIKIKRLSLKNNIYGGGTDNIMVMPEIPKSQI